MKKQIYKGIIIIFSLVWMILIFSDYFQKHPLYFIALERFPYWGLFLTLIGLNAIVVWQVLRVKKSEPAFLPITGGTLTAFALLLTLVISILFYIPFFKDLGLQSPEFGKQFLKILSSGIFTFFIVLVCYSLGTLISRLFSVKIRRQDQFVTYEALGIMTVVGLLFLLGTFHLITPLILFPLCILILGLSWKTNLIFLKNLFLKQIKLPNKLGILGIVSFLGIILIIVVNWIRVVSPMPKGFDSMNFYVNIPRLINDYEGLVEGFRPYNWSLFMSLGYGLFKQTEIALMLSTLGGILSLAAIYRLGRSWLKLNSNFLLFGILLFYLMPAVFVQSYGELKIDLGLLYIALTVILLYSNWLKSTKIELITNKNSPKESGKFNWKYFLDPHFTLIGLLSGFAMGIKLTGLFLIVAILTAIWYARGDLRAFFGAFSIGIAAALIARLDATIGMRAYHLGADVLGWLLLALGLGLLGSYFFSHRKAALKSLRLSIVYGVFCGLAFLPWMVKNYIETNSLSVEKLLNGKEPGPEINLQLMDENYNYKEEN